ncbi:MAG: FliH/SctL family protein [Acidimicrobiales bacterium]
MSSSPEAPARPRGRIVRAGEHRSLDLRDLATGSSLTVAAVDQATLVQLREAAYEEGFAQGLQEGVAAGWAQAERRLAEELDRRRAEAATVVAKLTAATERAVAADRLRLHELADDLLDTALTLAEDVLGHDVHWSPSAGQDALRRALAVLGDDVASFVARLHPDDLDSLGGIAGPAGASLEVVADPSVGRGGCIVEAGAARVDARLDTAMARVRAALATEVEP